jgi:hypothetical protein
MNEDVSGIAAFVTGAGGASGVMYLWIRSLLGQVASLTQEIKEERARNNEFGESIIEIATEAKLQIAASVSCSEDLKSHISEEHTKTRTEIRIRKDESKG